MMMTRLSLLASLALAGCTSGDRLVAVALPAVNVTASVETVPVGTGNADAADDPAIWHNPADPSASLIVGTDKKAGLYAYGLDGKVKSFADAGLLNNVDLMGNDSTALVVASDRTDGANSRLALFALSFADPVLRPIGTVPSGPGEAYGICLQRRDADMTLGALTAYAAIKDGTVREVRLTRGADGAYSGTIGRSWKLASQIEGCVTDPATGDLYVGEEDVGIWRIRTADPAAMPESFARVGEEQGLVADVEGLAFVAMPDGLSIVVASSQGDNAYSLLDARSGALIERFRIADGLGGNGETIDGTSETDGIELMLGDFGPLFPGGLFVAQDGSNPGSAQNFKFVSWDAVMREVAKGRPTLIGRTNR